MRVTKAAAPPATLPVPDDAEYEAQKLTLPADAASYMNAAFRLFVVLRVVMNRWLFVTLAPVTVAELYMPAFKPAWAELEQDGISSVTFNFEFAGAYTVVELPFIMLADEVNPLCEFVSCFASTLLKYGKPYGLLCVE